MYTLLKQMMGAWLRTHFAHSVQKFYMKCAVHVRFTWRGITRWSADRGASDGCNYLLHYLVAGKMYSSDLEMRKISPLLMGVIRSDQIVFPFPVAINIGIMYTYSQRDIIARWNYLYVLLYGRFHTAVHQIWN